MVVKKCDKCGKELQNLFSQFKFDTVITYLDEDEEGRTVNEKRRTQQRFDLCHDCAEKVWKWIREGTNDGE